MSKLKDLFKLFIGWPVSLLAILFIIKFLFERLPQITPHLSNINPFFLILSALLFFLYYFLRSILWKEILKNFNQEIGYLENAYRFGMSELKRFVPGNFASYWGRGVLYSEMKVPKEIIAKCLLFEVQLIIVGCFLASVLSFTWILEGNQDLKLKIASLLPLLLILVATFFVVIAFIFKNKYTKNHNIFSLLYLPGFSMLNKLKLTFYSFVVFFVFGFANFFIFLSIFPESFNLAIQLSSLFTLALLIGYLSFITPMGLGIREGVVTLGLLKILTLTQASFFAIFSRIVLIVSELSYLAIVILIYRFKTRDV